MSTVYERELRAYLEGDRESIAHFTKAWDDENRAKAMKCVEKPFLVVRAAGSLGADLVAVRESLSFLVEVKSSKEKLLHFSDAARLVDQLNEIRTGCSRAGVLPIYAYRLKNVRGADAWRVFTLDGMTLDGRPGLLYRNLPKMERTPKGFPVLRWENGQPLGSFLEFVTQF